MKKVKTLIEHANRHGENRAKAVGDVYSHPDPATLIATGFVEDVEAAKTAAAIAAKASTKKAPTAGA